MKTIILLGLLLSMSCTRIYFVCLEKPVELSKESWQLPHQSPDPGFNDIIRLHVPAIKNIYLGDDTIRSEYLQKYNLLDIRRNENN